MGAIRRTVAPCRQPPSNSSEVCLQTTPPRSESTPVPNLPLFPLSSERLSVKSGPHACVRVLWDITFIIPDKQSVLGADGMDRLWRHHRRDIVVPTVRLYFQVPRASCIEHNICGGVSGAIAVHE